MLRKLLALILDATIYGASNALNQILQFLLLPVYTHVLSKAEYGATGLLGMVVLLFGPLANLGMSNAIFRRFNQCKNPEERRAVMGTGLVSVVVSAATLGAIGFILAPYIAAWVGIQERDDATSLVRWAIFTAFLSAIGAIPLTTLRADRRVKTIGAINVSKVLIMVGSSVFWIVVMRWGVLGWILGILTGEAYGLAAGLSVTVRSYRPLADRAVWVGMLKYGLPFVPHYVNGVLLAQFGLNAVGRMLGEADAGIYNLAIKFTVPLAFVINAVQQAWVPYKFQIHAQDEDPAAFFRTAVTYYIAAISYLWVGLSLWGPELIRIMTQPMFHTAIALVSVVGLINVSQGLYYMMSTGLELTDKTRMMPLVSLGGLVSVVAGSFLLVPWLGAPGAALASIAGWLLMTSTIYRIGQRYFTVRYDWPALWGIGLLAAASGIAAYFAQQSPLGLRLGLAITLSLAYPAIVVAILSRSPTERHRMQILWSRLTGLWARKPAKT